MRAHPVDQRRVMPRRASLRSILKRRKSHTLTLRTAWSFDPEVLEPKAQTNHQNFLAQPQSPSSRIFAHPRELEDTYLGRNVLAGHIGEKIAAARFFFHACHSKSVRLSVSVVGRCRAGVIIQWIIVGFGKPPTPTRSTTGAIDEGCGDCAKQKSERRLI